jgi:SAM-dependent methyltransferase
VTNIYDAIGDGYTSRRRPDPRIADAIRDALGGAASVEPAEGLVVAVEPSPTMLRQRAPGTAPAVRATADALPFADASFDAAMAVLALHHWPDPRAGLAEMRRVARARVVILTWDADTDFWLLDYVPELHALDRQIFPALDVYRAALGDVEVRTLPIPHDCIDGFLGAYWRRPGAYLDPEVRAGMSTFARVDTRAGLARLERDLADGSWHRRHAALLAAEELDAGYRLVIARAD